MPDLPPDFRSTFEKMTEQLTADLFNAWTRGVCDGLEYAAKAADSLLEKVDGASAHDALLGMALGIREAQMAILIDNLSQQKEVSDEG